MISKIFIDDKKMEKEAERLLKYVGVYIKPDEKISNLTVGKQQMVEIAKAISFDSKILVLDEPTAALTEPEIDELFRIMNELKLKGIGMIYISHRMDEIERISDRVTVMRDGEYVGTVNTLKTTKEKIVKMMVGRAVLGEEKEKSARPHNSPVVLEVKNLNSGDKIKNVSFVLRKGEILGFSGLMGAGRTEVARAICGADKFTSGEIFVNNKKMNIKSPADAVKNGICYISEDRKRYGLLLDKSVTDNSVLASLDDYVKFGFINDKKALQKESHQSNTRKQLKYKKIVSSVIN